MKKIFKYLKDLFINFECHDIAWLVIIIFITILFIITIWMASIKFEWNIIK